YTEIIQPTVIRDTIIIRDTVYVDKPTEPTEPPVIPSGRIEAESFVNQQGVQIEGNVVGFIEPGDWIQYKVQTNKGQSLRFRYSLQSLASGRTMQVRSGSVDGPIIAEWTQQQTGNWNTFEEAVIPASPTSE